MATHPDLRIVSFSWDNVSKIIRQGQRDVIQTLGHDVEQYVFDRRPHAVFLNDLFLNSGTNDVLLILDIDALPLNKEVIDEAYCFARKGGIFGAAQVSNHLDPSHVFVAPCFLALSVMTWVALGRPTFDSNSTNDVAQHLTRIAQDHSINIKFLYPEFSCIPKYAFNDRFPYGIGTFYQGGIFHLFESRRQSYNRLFKLVAASVINSSQIDYVALARAARIIDTRLRLFESLKRPVRFARDFLRKIRARW